MQRVDGRAEHTTDAEERKWWVAEWYNGAFGQWVPVTSEKHGYIEGALRSLREFRKSYDISEARVVEVVERRATAQAWEPRAPIAKLIDDAT